MKKLATLFFCLFIPLLGISNTWEGATSYMNTATNWSLGAVPTVGQYLNFPEGTSIKAVNNNIPGTLVVGDVTIGAPYTFTGNGFSLSASHNLNFQTTGTDFGLPVTLSTGVTWAVSGNFSNTISGNIMGLGNIALTEGTLILKGNSSYTGSTIINGGTLQAGSHYTAFGLNSAVIIENGATLDLANNQNIIGSLSGVSGSSVNVGSAVLTIFNGNNKTFAGVISGADGGILLNGGVAIFSGLNTYSGPTIIANGSTLRAGIATSGNNSALGFNSTVTLDPLSTLDLYGFNTTIGNITGPTNSLVTLGSGSLTIADGNNETFSGVISGPGGVTLNSGVFTLGNANSHTGTTLIKSGAQLNFTGTGNIVGALSNLGTVQVSSFITPTVITNLGTITSSGSFSINSGTINNLIGGVIKAANGQTLTINGGAFSNDSSSSIGSLTSNLSFLGGTISSAGKLLANNYIQGASSSISCNILSSNSFGSVTAIGSASLNGALIVTALPDYSLTDGQIINLVTAANGLGATTFLNTTFVGFRASSIPELIYLSNAVQLSVRDITTALHSTKSAHIVMTTALHQHNFFLSRKCFELQNRFSKFITPQKGNSQKPKAKVYFQEVDIPNFDSADTIKIANPEIPQKERALSTKLMSSPAFEENPWSLYLGPIGSIGHVQKKGNQQEFSYNSIGALIGLDYAFPNKTRENPADIGLGVVFDYRYAFHHELFITDALHGSIYTTLIPKAIPYLAFDAIIGYTYNWSAIKRKTGPYDTLTATLKPKESQFDIFIDFEYTLPYLPQSFNVVPLATLQYIYTHQGSAREKGANMYNLSLDQLNTNSLSSIFGSRFSYLFKKDKYSIQTELDAGYELQYLNLEETLTFTPFNITSTSSTTTAYLESRNSLILALDIFTTIGKNFQLEANATYKYNNLYYDVFFYLGVGAQF